MCIHICFLTICITISLFQSFFWCDKQIKCIYALFIPPEP
uniref:Uncharacterized protein n=1 Tax=Rhizophora mucronata TaxID=61149 RepID=A0A2P2IXG7_RHIMU